MKKVSRRELARTVAGQLLDGADRTKLVNQVSAYLIENRMSSQLDMLLQDIAVELQQQTGTVSATVEAAHPVSTELEAQLKQRVQSLTAARDVELNVTLNPDLIGGVVIKIPGSELDLSVRRKLTSLSREGA